MNEMVRDEWNKLCGESKTNKQGCDSSRNVLDKVGEFNYLGNVFPKKITLEKWYKKIYIKWSVFNEEKL